MGLGPVGRKATLVLPRFPVIDNLALACANCRHIAIPQVHQRPGTGTEYKDRPVCKTRPGPRAVASARPCSRGAILRYNEIDMSNTSEITEAEILEKVVVADQPGLSPDVARLILDLHFNSDADERIRSLLKEKNAGKITETESAELDKYLRVGQFIDLLQAKARLSLRSAGSS